MGRARSGPRRPRQPILPAVRSAGGLQARRRGAEAARPLAGVRDGLAIAPRRRRRRRDRRPRHAPDGGFCGGWGPNPGPPPCFASPGGRAAPFAAHVETGCLRASSPAGGGPCRHATPARARRLGATTSLDVSTDPQGWPEERIEAVRICLPHVDVFFGNETEVAAVAGEHSPIQAGKRLRSFGAAEVVIHQGDRGATAITSSGVVPSAAFDVAIDNPTGCGDVFNAAYAYAKLTQPSVKEWLRFANAAAALHLRNRRRPYPTLPEIRRFLRGFAAP